MHLQKLRYHFLKHHVVSSALRAGVSTGKSSDPSEVRAVVQMLRPTGVELVRVGGHHDGGYLLPDDIEGIRTCFSPGVAEQASFETDLGDRGIQSFMIDGSVDNAPVPSEMFHFAPLFLDVVDQPGRIRLQTWVEQSVYPDDRDLLLQMDIEGNEWATLLDTSDDVLARFRIIVLELHEFERIFDLFGIRIIRAVLEKLLRSFVVVHVHPNNYSGEIGNGDLVVPRVPEVTFLRRDRLKEVRKATVRLPHPLDQVNGPEFAHLDFAGSFLRHIGYPA